ncbi:hypothetical protein GF324_10295 [bacterium]|nr:hypothetical protein [bacterium]
MWGLLYLLTMAAVLASVVADTGGRFAYSLDDAYIHLAVAENLVEHGIWGVTPYHFSWSSSSLLWTLLLAILYVPFQSVFVWVPLGVNILIGFALLYIADRREVFFRLSAESSSSFVRHLMPGMIVLLGPLPLLTVNGMEHLLHALLTLVFLREVVLRGVDSDRSAEGTRQTIVLAMWAMVLGAVRYEAILLLFAVCAWWLLRGQWRRAVMVGIAAWIPAATGGWIAVFHGWEFFPYSVLLKTTPMQMQDQGAGIALVKTILRNGFFVFLPVIAALAAAARLRTNVPASRTPTGPLSQLRAWMHSYDKSAILLLLYTFAVLLHLVVARTGWQGRYEAWFVLTGIILLPLAGAGAWRQLRVWTKRSAWGKLLLVYVSLNLIGFAGHRLYHWNLLVAGPLSIHDQQVQMGRFLGEYYNKATVLANDIGAINVYSDIRCIDFIGLGTKEAGAGYLHEGVGKRDMIERLERLYQPDIAVLYASWLGGPPPSHWTLCGRWVNPRNMVGGDETVSFFAFTPGGAERLRHALEAFRSQLPETVRSEVCANSP